MSGDLFKSKLTATEEDMTGCCGEYIAGRRCQACPDRHHNNEISNSEPTKKRNLEKIDWTKPVKTRNGCKAIVLTTSLDNMYCPVAATVTYYEGIVLVHQYTLEGRYLMSVGSSTKESSTHELDLVNIEEEKGENILGIVMSLIASSGEVKTTLWGDGAEDGYITFKNGDKCEVRVRRSNEFDSTKVVRRWINVYDNMSVGRPCSTVDASNYLATQTSLALIGRIRLVFEEGKLVDVGLEKLNR